MVVLQTTYKELLCFLQEVALFHSIHAGPPGYVGPTARWLVAEPLPRLVEPPPAYDDDSPRRSDLPVGVGATPSVVGGMGPPHSGDGEEGGAMISVPDQAVLLSGMLYQLQRPPGLRWP